jgi:hypothetical protein
MIGILSFFLLYSAPPEALQEELQQPVADGQVA